MPTPRLQRGVFGYRKKSVQAALTERDRLVTRASEQARTAAARVRELEAAVRDAAARMAELAERTARAEEAAERFRGEADSVREAAERSTDALARAARMELQARTARDELAEVQEQLRLTQARQAQLERQLNSARSQGGGGTAPADRLVVSVSETPATAEDLEKARAAADRAVGKIVEAARVRGEEELRRLERVRGATQVEMDRWSTWRDRFSQAISDLRWALADALRSVDELRERLGGTPETADRALSELDRRLDHLRQVAADIPSEDAVPEGTEGGTRLIAIPEPEPGTTRGRTPPRR
ncbi:MAG: hypothetical protein ACE14W_05835 [Candidatus Velamenicoccus archaeovorus]